MEFHAGTSRLIQMLEKGHHGVQLNDEAWNRLITWIDLNARAHGTWSEFTRIKGDQNARRCELRAMYGGRPENGEEIVHGDPPFGGDLTPVMPQPKPTKSASEEEKASSRFRLVGSTSMPEHDSRFEHRGSWIFSEEYLGWPLNAPDQPVVRISWEEANAFCRRLSERSGRHIRLPTEEEWEYACRAGTTTPFWFGTQEADSTRYANLADRSLRLLAADSWGPKPPDLAARDDRFEDGHLVTAKVGSFRTNPFGLYDMHGNVAEWTCGRYEGQRRAVRGGSWRDLPGEAHASERVGYQPFQKVVDVGFRIVCEDDQLAEVTSR